MNIEKLFEIASREKYRFDSTKGQLAVEDLWRLPLKSKSGQASLDDIAKSLHSQSKNDDDISFVDENVKSDPTIQNKFELVKYIIQVLLAEQKAKITALDNAEKKREIQQVLAERQGAALKGKSDEELREMLNTLG